MKKMKCLTLIFSIAIFPYFGCVGLEIERHVTENVFYSSMSPKVKVKVDPAFMFIGKIEKKIESQNPGGSLLHIKNLVYMFAHVGDTNKIQGLALIKFRILDQGTALWVNAFRLRDEQPGIFSETVNIHGEDYDGIVGVTNFQGEFWELERKSLKDKEYRLSDLYFVKLLNRMISNTSMTIYYIEDFKHVEKNALTRTERPVFSFGTEQLKSEQERALYRYFLVNSEKNIQILDKDA